MYLVGLALLFAALVAAAFAVVEWRKARPILGTPLRRTGERHRFGRLSCQGAICPPVLSCIAPHSGASCIYYEVDVTENGKVHTDRSGEVFYLDDGTGPVAVDPRRGMDVELVTSYRRERRGRTIVERIVPASGDLFVSGTFDRDRVLVGPLVASRRGRRPLAREAVRGVFTGMVGALLAFPAIAILICQHAAGAAMPGAVAPCAILDNATCRGSIHDDDGANVRLDISQAGTFMLTAGNKHAWLALKDASGRVILTNAPGAAAIDLAAGAYTVHISDSMPGHAERITGGLPYHLSVTRAGLQSPAPSIAAVSARPGSGS